MECSENHNLLNVKFCPRCGAKVVKTVNCCVNGHQMKSDQKFCADCGGRIASGLKFQEKIDRNLPTFNNNLSQTSTTVSSSQLPWPNENPMVVNNQSGISQNSKFTLIGVGILILIVFIAMLSGSKPEPVTVTVEMTLVDTECWEMSWGYGDIPNGQVIVSVDGVAAGFGSYPPIGSSSIRGCKFIAYIGDVPSDGESYSVSMASGRRGTIYNSRSELESNSWTFELSLG
jgi:ribosomal protein S27AE